MTPVYLYTILLALLFLKHGLADGPLQTSVMYINKGKYGHPGGFLHAFIHVFLSALVYFGIYVAFSPDANMYAQWVLAAIGVEFVAHYHIDWLKVRLTKKYKWASLGEDDKGRFCQRIYDNTFYVALMADQVAHFLTYLLFARMVMWGMGV